MQNTLPTPWDFSNVERSLYSPDASQRLEYSELYEVCQGGPLRGACYWITPDNQRIKLPVDCGGPPVWEERGQYVAVPVWQGSAQRIGVLLTQQRTFMLFRKRFRVLQLKQYQGVRIIGEDSPIHQPQPVLFNVRTAAIARTFTL